MRGRRASFRVDDAGQTGRPPHNLNEGRSMKFKFEVVVEVERVQGKFATRDELAEQIVSALEDANTQTMQGDAEGEYEVLVWEVTEARK